MINKLTTMGYFIKRLRGSGYVVDKLFSGYAMIDQRTWSVVIDPGGASLFITCYQNDPEVGHSYFEMYDGGRFIPSRLKLETSSIETFVGYLVNFGVNRKSKHYEKRDRSDNKHSN